MKVYDILRKTFGENGEEFVEYPVTSQNKDWNDVKYTKIKKRRRMTCTVFSWRKKKSTAFFRAVDF